MKITRIIIGIAASLVLPLAGAIADAASNPSVSRADAQRSASHAYDYGRDSRGKSGQDSKYSKNSRSGKSGKGSKGSKGSGKGSHGSNGGHGSKSSSKPKRGG